MRLPMALRVRLLLGFGALLISFVLLAHSLVPGIIRA